jgi:hypothetical protein
MIRNVYTTYHAFSTLQLDMAASEQERFMKRVVVSGSGCWPFVTSSKSGWYGRLHWPGRGTGYVYAHRLAFELFHGVIPGEKDVLHSCDNPPCCNPAHLHLGDATNNAREMVDRNRWSNGIRPRGEANSKARLTNDKVVQIRALAASNMSYRKIATEFSICPATVAQVVRRKTWRHI